MATIQRQISVLSNTQFTGVIVSLYGLSTVIPLLQLPLYPRLSSVFPLITFDSFG